MYIFQGTLPVPPRIRWTHSLSGLFAVVTSLGKLLEYIKTYVSANRNALISEAVREVWARGLIKGFYQGLVPWAWLEASTKGAILILTSSEVQYRASYALVFSRAVAAAAGGAAQSYLTMVVTTCMKTVEVIRNKTAAAGKRAPGTMETFANILCTQGIRGANKRVSAVALENRARGFFRGVIPRIGVAAWATVCTVGLGDVVLEIFDS